MASVSLDMPSSGSEPPPMSLMEKLRAHYRHGAIDSSGSARATRALFIFQAVTQIYVTNVYLVPFVFEDVHPTLQYCLQVLAAYLFTMGVANWLCVICYGNFYKPTKDRPDINLNIYADNPPERFIGSLAPNLGHQGNGHVTVDVTEKGGLPWLYCKRCEMNIPPRAHHCKFCKRCVLRRDHHCFLVGCCIGHFNQRYFVVLAGYGIVVGYVGAWMTITYLYHHHLAHQSLWDYFLPCSLYQWVVNEMSALQFLLTFHAYMLCLFGPISNIYFLSQLSIISQGRTLYEAYKKKHYRITSTLQENFRLVFGDYWLVNFLFPAQILFKQDNDGLHYPGVKMPVHKPRPQLTYKASLD